MQILSRIRKKETPVGLGMEVDLKKIADTMNRQEAASLRFQEHHSDLLKEHPNKWVALGPNGIVTVTSSFEEALDEVQRLVDPSPLDVAIEYLDPNPMRAIL